MVPVAAVGIQQVVEKVTESSSAPIQPVDRYYVSVDTLEPETPVITEPVVQSPGSTNSPDRTNWQRLNRIGFSGASC